MVLITILLVAAAVALGASRALNLPSVPLFVLVGVAIAVSGAVDDAELLEDILLLGLTFLVFVAGTDLNPGRIGEHKRTALVVGLAQFFLLALIGLVLALLAGYELRTALYISLALTASSTLVVVGILRRRQQFFEPFGRVVLGVLLVQDVLIIALLSLLIYLDATVTQLAGTAGALAILATLAWFGVKWGTPYLLLKLGLDEETLLLAVLGILFSFVGISHVMGLPPVAGAFFAGVALSGFPVNGLIRGQLSSLSDFFQALFFVTLGATLILPGATQLLLVGAMAAIVLLVTPPLVLAISQRMGLSLRNGIESGLLLAQCSEFSIVVALLGMKSGHLDPELLSVIALITVITMMLTPFIATQRNALGLMHHYPGTRREKLEGDWSDHLLLIGCGSNGRQFADRVLKQGIDVVVIDDDPATVRALQQDDIPAIRGSGVDRHVLAQAHANDARVIVSTMPRFRDNESLVELKLKPPVWVRVFDLQQADVIRRLGGRPVVYSESAVEDFIRWFEEDFRENAVEKSENAAP